MAPQEVVGFAGLGNMGLAMAANLQEFLSKQKPDGAFAPLFHVYNRTASKADTLVEQGAERAASIADLAGNCTIVFSMLANDAAVRETFDAFLAASPKQGTIFADCSTVYPSMSEEQAVRAAEKGVLYLTTPIFGRPDAIHQHNGLMVCSGDPAARKRVRPLLDSIGQAVLDCGDSVRTSNAMKLVGNFFIVGFTELVAEGMTLGEKNGVQREWVVQYIERMFPGFVTKGYVNAVAGDKFQPTPENPGFSLTGGIKDVGHMQRLGRESGAPMPVVDIMLQHMNTVKEMGGGDLDWSSLALAVRKEAGLPLSHLG